jgi:hypothetical protein
VESVEWHTPEFESRAARSRTTATGSCVAYSIR